ncbi:hypothetical protein [Nocardioides aequoreus]|uniref:hypothetical protein n=1 Tax=Nocardioides aequoreus TaxID=397278 RepID=UPI0004C44503|nr:hypothetical protein [Nocardioides aequoreus]
MTSWTAGLLDDAAVLSGRALAPALQAHHAVRRGPGGEAVGAFCVTERELTHLRTDDLPVHLAITGGAGALEAALRWTTGNPGRVSLRRVSVRLRGEETPARNARRVVAVLDSVELDDDVEVYAAPPPGPVSPAWLGALDELALREVGLLLDGPPDPGVVDAALDRELAMVVTADSPDDVVAALTTCRTVLDGAAPAPDWLTTDPDAAARTRRWCRALVVPDLPSAERSLPDRPEVTA